MDNEEVKEGLFSATLARNNKEIRKDRAQAMARNTETIYRRKVEDMMIKKQNLESTREASLDLSPGTSTDLHMQQFDADKWADQDITIGKQIYNLSKEIELAQARYQELFGKPVVL